MLRGISGILCLHSKETLRQEYGRDRERRRTGNLPTDEDALKGQPRWGGPLAGAKRVRGVDARHRQRGDTAAEHDDEEATEKSDRDRRHVQADALDPWQPGWPRRGQELQQRGGHQETGNAGREPEREVLGKELTHQSGPAGAERGAHRQLAAPPCGASGEQPAGVGAGNQ